MSDNELDHNNKVYPSIEGLVHQIVDALETSSDYVWYSFKRPIYGPETGEVLLEAISYDEDGEEEKFYHVSIKVEAI